MNLTRLQLLTSALTPDLENSEARRLLAEIRLEAYELIIPLLESHIAAHKLKTQPRTLDRYNIDDL